ncbi:hypothetical protein LEP1GSC059_0316 [Leptospira noguchii serovar Panama str. CZ214]|uniref:Uncharacterized protein n=1 Tax=Leptospira noguchii serovar Panama str. CZ214 TaxID=1001595 RepID=T0GX07_9LEPT|nr:hypothetical protein LEP1GSC059_0316 [Leptospira noguchii serovar Panama str. CZ214]
MIERKSSFKTGGPSDDKKPMNCVKRQNLWELLQARNFTVKL